MDITPKLSPEKPALTGGRKRNVNSSTLLATTTSLLDTYLQDCQHQPSSPASSSTSQTTGDTTFEPSIDMMVNDFDDEQTLTEEEALAEREAQDPADEIATLQKESEMPLEELLAHYKQHVERDHQQRRHKKKKSVKKNKTKKQSKKSSSSGASISTTIIPFPVAAINEVIVIDESDDEVELLKIERTDTDLAEDENSVQDVPDENQIDEEEDGDDGEGDVDEIHADVDFDSRTVDYTKRSHLLELYPEKFASVQQKLDDDLSEDDDDDASDYVKKTIMVGSAYQAIIPSGLSKYGDVLPYENEDKLIWEPSQVSEQEVEDYLIRVREIKSMTTSSAQEEEVPSSSASVTSESDQGLGSSLVKDDEQALHLLVQCGYNFKEALRRKRLNAVPLTGSMSLWSEEECRNFEEGIQKFGKDFRKIRQTQVRTRSIRELVQFYYLWKKTERRDQDFVDSDTTDHMDIYLDFDERDTGSNGGSGKHVSSSLTSEGSTANQTFQTRKQHHHATTSSTLLNFSIMNETKRLAANCHSNSKKASSSKKVQTDNNRQQASSSYRRRNSLLSADKIYNHAGDSNNVFTTKYTPDVSSPPGGGVGGGGTVSKTWRNNSNATTSSSSSTISSTTGNHCNKK